MIRTCGSRKGLPVAPIGKVNLKTGENAMFGVVWNCWEEDPTATNMLVANSHLDQLYIVHTCGAGYPDGDMFDLVHDQTNRWIGQGKWRVIASRPHTKEGLKELAQIANKTSLPMATFK